MSVKIFTESYYSASMILMMISHLFSDKYVEIEPTSSRTKTFYKSHSGHGFRKKGEEGD